ncbi:MAG TPA: MFS transporter [Streptosporangiaceae bacterium]|nr:MFS transporter [Streptosporangiaceae bacterium]
MRSLSPLRHRRFRLLVGGQLTSNVGDAFYAVALPWYVLATHGGPLLLGTVLAAYGIPRTALLVVGGHLSDRWRPWTIMMATDAVRAIAMTALAVTAMLGPARAIVLVPIAVVLGSGAGLFMPGSFAIVPALLPGDDLQAGNALVSGGTQFATLIGPAVGGALVALAGPAPAFAVDAASFVVSALTLAGLRAAGTAGQEPAEPASGPAEPAGPTVRTLLRTERILQLGLLVTVAANLGSGGLDEVALPSLAHGPLHSGAVGYGWLIAAFGAGALAGTIVAGQASQARRPFLVGSLAFLGEAVCIAVAPFLGSTPAVAAALLGVGVMNGFGNVLTITAFQRWVPPALLGRLSGLMMLSSLGSFPISVALAALFVRHLGAASFFVFAAATLAVAILAGLSQRTWRDFGTDRPSDQSSTIPVTGAPATADPARGMS